MDSNFNFHKWKGIDVAKDILKNIKNDVIVYFDPDVDGMVAGYFICKYLTTLGKSFKWYVNENRSHDWSIPVEKLKGRDIIAVDFMITDSKIKEIVKSGSNIISIDHHINQNTFIDFKYKGKRGCVINNQYPFESEDGRYLSGAGVVFETLRLLNENFDTDENRALVGLTLLSDVCDIENISAKSYLKVLYNHKYKGYIKYLIENTMGDKDYGFGVPRLDRKYVDYKFSPAINACLRFNKGDDVVKFFLGSGRLDLSYHKRQKELVKKMLETANVIEFSNIRVVFVKEWEIETLENTNTLSNFIGLLASRFLDGKKSVIAYSIGINSKGIKCVKRASFRGNINGYDYLKDIQGIVECAGHQSAFGILNLKPSKLLFDSINDVCKREKGFKNKSNVIPVSNLSIFSNREGKSVADYNMYCLSQNSKYIRYVGNNIKVRRRGNNFIKYNIDGIEVVAFDDKINFSNGLIYPILERGFINYYLQDEK